LIFTNCQQYNSPNNNLNEKKVKNETIWNCDINTEHKTSIHSIKDFDIDGKLILWQIFDDKGYKITDCKYEYKNQISIEYKKVFKPSGELDTATTSSIFYDKKGKIVSKVIQSQEGDTVTILNFTYDNLGNILKKVELNPQTNSQIETVYSYQYNNEGNIIERLINPADNGLYQSKDSLIYKPSESKVERIFYETYGQVSAVFTYIYNQFGKIIKEYQQDNQGNVIKKFLYEYIYW
jgi:hypothetical protein